MKKPLKLLVTSALVTLTFSSLQKSQGADYSDNPPITLSTHLRYSQKSFDDFLRESVSLYHQVSTERYRESVATARKNVHDLQNEINLFRKSNDANEAAAIQRLIKEKEEKLSHQREIFKKYGSGQDLPYKINKKISVLKSNIEANNSSIKADPAFTKFYQNQNKDYGAQVTQCKADLEFLQKNHSDLEAELAQAKAYLAGLTSVNLESQLDKESRHLQSLYNDHVNVLDDPNIFSPDLPKEVLRSLGFSPVQLRNIREDYLFQLFARSMELPYIYVQTNETKESAYRDQLKTIKGNLINRLVEGVDNLQVLALMASGFAFDIKKYSGGEDVKKYFKDIESAKKSNKSEDLEILKTILSDGEKYNYKYSLPSDKQEEAPARGGFFGSSQQQEPPSEEAVRFSFLKSIVDSVAQSPSYGVLGLCTAALERTRVTSWNSPEHLSVISRAQRIKEDHELTNIIGESIYTLLSRYINVKVLEKIDERIEKKKLQGQPESHKEIV